MEETEVDDIIPAEALGWAEFCSWSDLAMAPFIYGIHGPSVLKDQFVVRPALVVIAAAGGDRAADAASAPAQTLFATDR